MVSGGAINILVDVVFTIEGTAGGDDGNKTRTGTGTAITFKADTVRVSQSRTVADHGTAQDAAEFNRTTKLPESLTVETKLEKNSSAALMGLLQSSAGVVVLFSATAAGATIDDAVAIVENIEFEYAGPSTLRFTLRQYGSLWTIKTATS